jgi:hypothetical protein
MKAEMKNEIKETVMNATQIMIVEIKDFIG